MRCGHLRGVINNSPPNKQIKQGAANERVEAFLASDVTQTPANVSR